MSDVKWVPDEEVNECPMCTQKFGTLFSLRRHHCRACGKVVCGSCSNNSIVLPGGRYKERVCDPCHTFHLHQGAASLTEHMGQHRQMQDSLKANLNEKHRQIVAYRVFLQSVVAAGEVGGILGGLRNCASEDFSAAVVASPVVSPKASPRGTPTGSLGSGAAASVVEEDTEQAEMRILEGQARRRWTQACKELRSSAEAIGRLQRENTDLEGTFGVRHGEMQRMERHVQGLKADLKDAPVLTAERDKLSQDNQTLRRELEGLSRRMATLQAEQDRANSSRSFTSSFSSAPENVRQHCRETCGVM